MPCHDHQKLHPLIFHYYVEKFHTVDLTESRSESADLYRLCLCIGYCIYEFNRFINSIVSRLFKMVG